MDISMFRNEDEWKASIELLKKEGDVEICEYCTPVEKRKDIAVKCIVCFKHFTITVDEQIWFEKEKILELPKRCEKCYYEEMEKDINDGKTIRIE